MKKDDRILVAGVGHLSFQVYRQLKEKGYSPTRVVSDPSNKTSTSVSERSVYEHYQTFFETAGIKDAETVYLLDDDDQYNIQFFLIAAALNPNAHLVVSLFNDSLAPHLRSGHELLSVFNPAAIAAEEFVKAAENNKARKMHARLTDAWFLSEQKNSSLFNSLVAISVVFVGIFIFAMAVFHYMDKLSWIDSFYFTGTVITTTGFGDISLLHSSPLLKIFGVLLMFVGVSFISIAFSLIVEWLLSRRVQLALGHKQYKLRGHIILCGLGRLGYQVTLELLKRGHDVLVLEQYAENRFIDSVRSAGGHVFVADASLSRNLRLANVAKARSILSVMQDDLKNLEVGLTARSIQSEMPLVLRIFDHDVAEEMRKRLSIPVALSASAIAAAYLLKDK